MGNLLYLIAIILLVFWTIGFFIYTLGSMIHVLLVFAIISILMRLLEGKKPI